MDALADRFPKAVQALEKVLSLETLVLTDLVSMKSFSPRLKQRGTATSVDSKTRQSNIS